MIQAEGGAAGTPEIKNPLAGEGNLTSPRLRFSACEEVLRMHDLQWFPFYVDRFMGSRKVQRMTADMAGGYLFLLIDEWRNGPIPSEDAAFISRLDDADAMRLLCDCFAETPDGWVNVALEEVREEQEAKANALSRAGTAGAKARWAQRKYGKRNATAMRPQSEANGIRGEEKRVEEKRKDPTAPLPPASANVENSGHAELAAWLGPHADCLTGVERMTKLSIWGIWGPHGTEQGAWRGMATDRQPPILATAILSWSATKPRQFYRPFFAKILAHAIDDAIASERQEGQRRTEETTANDSRDQARRIEEAEIARLNAEAMMAKAPALKDHPTKPARGIGLERISA